MPTELAPSDTAYQNFDSEKYLIDNPDVAAARMDALYHYVNFGAKEGRGFPTFPPSKPDAWARIESSGLFDAEWYLQAYDDVAGSGQSPLEHFCLLGLPSFRDPSRRFSTGWYVAQNPDIVGMNPLLHYIEHGRSEGRSPLPPRESIVTVATDVYQSVKKLEGALEGSAKFQNFLAVPFVSHVYKPDRVKKALAEIVSQMSPRCTHFIFVPSCINTGTYGVAATFAREAVLTLGVDRVCLFVVDCDQLSGRNRFPASLKIVNFASACNALGLDEKKYVLEKLIQICRPSHCLNINSSLVWDLYRSRGALLARHYCKLYAFLFCRDFDEYGVPGGYADTHLRETFQFLTEIYSDNDCFVRWACQELGVVKSDRSRLVTLRQPAQKAYRRSGSRGRISSNAFGMNILWCNRISFQTNVSLLAAIIKHSPTSFKFHIWGQGEDKSVQELLSAIEGDARAIYYGAYTSFNDLPHERYHAYLYTSRWDGMPNTILEAASHGYPIVAPDVGGVSELVSFDTGWLIDRIDEPTQYVEALAEIMTKPREAGLRGAAVEKLLHERFALDIYLNQLTTNDGYLRDGC